MSAAVAPLLLIALLFLGLRRPFAKVRSDFRRSVERQLEASPRTRWLIGGMMGSGKTTFARQLAAALRVPHIEIDCHPSEEALVDRIGACPTGWVAEANPWQIPPRVVARGDAIVFLDYDDVVTYV